MINPEEFDRIAKLEQTSLFPNIVREYAQHLFLTQLYQSPQSEKLLFKGGTALRIVYSSPRFSEDLDFSLFGVLPQETQTFVENLFLNVLGEMERAGIRVEIGNKSAPTTGGYFGIATLHPTGFPPINIEINISSRGIGAKSGEVDSISNNFVPTYNLYHLPQEELVEEKIFGAMMARKKPRDYYDLYFMLRSNMLSPGQKTRLGQIANTVISDIQHIDFQGELGTFLPVGQQTIIRDFAKTLERELRNQLSFN